MSDVNWGCCPLVAQTPTVRAFIEQLAKERKAQSTIENYSRDLNDFLSAFPEIPFSELLEADESCIADYVDWLWKREAQRGNGHILIEARSRTSQDQNLHLRPSGGVSVLYGAFTAGRSGSVIAVIPSTRFAKECVENARGLVSTPASIPWIPDEHQWKAILKFVLTTLSTRDQAIVLLAHDGALRREEIVRLRVDDIDWRTQTITVRAEISKNKMPGTIVLSHPTWTRLKEYLEEDRAALAATFGAEANGPIFLSDSHRNPGQPLSKWTVKDIFDRISDALQIPQLTPHKMRHLMLTELKKSGMDLLDVSRYARHRTIASTEIYLHTDLSDLARQVNKVHQHVEKLLVQMEEGEKHDGQS